MLDLFTATEKQLQQLGPESSKRWFDWIPAGEFAADSKQLEDDTHFNSYGASRVCDLAMVEIEAKIPALAAHLVGHSKNVAPVTPSLDPWGVAGTIGCLAVEYTPPHRLPP